MRHPHFLVYFSLNSVQYNSLGLAVIPYDDAVVKSLPHDDTQDDQGPYGLRRWRYALYSHWELSFAAIIESDSEDALRSGTDFLIQLAFQHRSGWKHRVR